MPPGESHVSRISKEYYVNYFNCSHRELGPPVAKCCKCVFFFLTFHQVFISNHITELEYVTLSISVVWHVRVRYRGHLSFRLFLYAMSLNYLRSIRILKIRLLTVWNVFLLYCCFFGWQGRRHKTLFHSVFDVILVQVNEWIPVLLKCR